MRTIKMKKLSLLITVLLLFSFGCSNEDVFNSESDSISTADLKSSHGKVVHTAIAGTNDACEAFGLPNGCDGNFSLNARLYEDGTASGEWQDTFSGGGGIHVKIDCAHFGETDGTQWAVIAGEVTNGDPNFPGNRAVTLVVDNVFGSGVDAMSFTFPFDGDCQELDASDFNPYYFPIGAGQVIIR